MAKETGYFRVYRIREETKHNEITSYLKERGYDEIKITTPKKLSSKISLSSWICNAPKTKPEWFHAIDAYLDDIEKEKIGYKTRCDLVILVTIKEDDNNQRIFVLPGSMGAIHLQQFFDHQFGLDVLARVFDETQNRISNLDEKAVTGEILASIRFYRFPRSLGQEDVFGKIFNRLSIQITEAQMKDYLPSLFEYKNENKLKISLTLDGASFFDFKATLPFDVLLNTVLNLNIILDQPPVTEFNKTLIPLVPRKDKKQIEVLREKLKNDFLTSLFEKELLDISICPKEFVDFHDSQWITTPSITLDDKVPLDKLTNLEVIRDYFESAVKDIADEDERKDKLNKAYDKLYIKTYKEGFEQPQTSGHFIAYCNAEISCDGNHYFIFNNSWYELKSGFDDDLNAKYKDRILESHFENNYKYALEWEKDQPEADYLKQCKNKNSGLWLIHPLKIGNYLEVCDMILPKGDGVDLIFAKIGVNVSVRDFVSQVKITARLLEQEIRQKDKIHITKLYETLVKNNQIPADLTKEDFLKYFSHSIANYRFIMIFQSKDSKNKLRTGKFKSRIAKFSLLEFEEYMRGKNLIFKFVPR